MKQLTEIKEMLSKALQDCKQPDIATRIKGVITHINEIEEYEYVRILVIQEKLKEMMQAVQQVIDGQDAILHPPARPLSTTNNKGVLLDVSPMVENIQCVQCNGTGYKHGIKSAGYEGKCPDCNGHGILPKLIGTKLGTSPTQRAIIWPRTTKTTTWDGKNVKG